MSKKNNGSPACHEKNSSNRWHGNISIITVRKENLCLGIMFSLLTTQLYMLKTYSRVSSDTTLQILQKSIASDWVKMGLEKIWLALVAGATPGVS